MLGSICRAFLVKALFAQTLPATPWPNCCVPGHKEAVPLDVVAPGGDNHLLRYGPEWQSTKPSNNLDRPMYLYSGSHGPCFMVLGGPGKDGCPSLSSGIEASWGLRVVVVAYASRCGYYFCPTHSTAFVSEGGAGAAGDGWGH